MGGTVDDIVKNPLPDGISPHQVTHLFTIVEYVDDDGELAMQFLASARTPTWRALGLVDAVAAQLRQDFTEANEDG